MLNSIIYFKRPFLFLVHADAIMFLYVGTINSSCNKPAIPYIIPSVSHPPLPSSPYSAQQDLSSWQEGMTARPERSSIKAIGNDGVSRALRTAEQALYCLFSSRGRSCFSRPAFEGWLHLYAGGWNSRDKNSLRAGCSAKLRVVIPYEAIPIQKRIDAIILKAIQQR